MSIRTCRCAADELTKANSVRAQAPPRSSDSYKVGAGDCTRLPHKDELLVVASCQCPVELITTRPLLNPIPGVHVVKQLLSQPSDPTIDVDRIPRRVEPQRLTRMVGVLCQKETVSCQRLLFHCSRMRSRSKVPDCLATCGSSLVKMHHCECRVQCCTMTYNEHSHRSEQTIWADQHRTNYRHLLITRLLGIGLLYGLACLRCCLSLSLLKAS